MEKNIIKKSEMSVGYTYILCPDSNCKIFFDEKKFCIYDCPHLDKARQIDYCDLCKKLDEREINFSISRRKDHKCNESTNSKFCNGKWILIYDYPQEE